MKIILLLILLISNTACGKNGNVICIRQDKHINTEVRFEYHNESVLKELEKITIEDLNLDDNQLALITKVYNVEKRSESYYLTREIDYRDLNLIELNHLERIDKYKKDGYLNVFKTISNYEKSGFVCKY